MSEFLEPRASTEPHLRMVRRNFTWQPFLYFDSRPRQPMPAEEILNGNVHEEIVAAFNWALTIDVIERHGRLTIPTAEDRINLIYSIATYAAERGYRISSIVTSFDRAATPIEDQDQPPLYPAS